MLGRSDSLHLKDPGHVYVLPANPKAEQFQKKIVELASQYSPSLSPVFNYPFKEERISVRGDFLYFSNVGIPSIDFFTGVHGDYHTPQDTPEKLNYIKMTNIARLAFALAWNESGILKR